MEKKQLKRLIDVAAGRIKANLVLKNCQVVDVYGLQLKHADIAVVDGLIAGIGEYYGSKEQDIHEAIVMPGLIDGHIHIESAYVTPEEIGALLVPHGTSTIIADPHEIVNVCGLAGLDYMLSAAQNTKLDIKFMLPSCVPATPFEHAGAVITAQTMENILECGGIHGVAEFMDFPGVIHADDAILDKLLAAKKNGKIIDGHGPGLSGTELNAYIAAGISTDHEAMTIAEMQEKISKGMYILMRNGSACHDLPNLLAGVTPENERRCLFCSDDRQPKTIFTKGHLEEHLKLCVKSGISPFAAIRMASLNAAECYGLKDRGAIVPGKRADLVIVDDLVDFHVSAVYLKGILTAKEGKYLPAVKRRPIDTVTGSFHVKDFSRAKLTLPLQSKHVKTIDIEPGGVVTAKGTATVNLDENGCFLYSPEADIVKIAVIERHKNTGNVAVALLRNYGIKRGAIAISIAHDSHNIIVVGTNDIDMEYAVNELIEQEGGMVLVYDEKVIASMALPIAGLMSDQSGQWVNERLTLLHKAAREKLGVSAAVDPIMTLCFMSLPVIPELKLTDMGLFDVTKFAFTSVEAD